MSLHTWHYQGPHKAAAPPSRSALPAAEMPQAKNVLSFCVQGRFGSVQLFVIL